MRRLLVILFLALLAMSCGPRAEAVTADAVARVVNASVDPLLSTYEAEGLAAIRNANTVEELMLAIPTVQERWQPLWSSLGAFAIAHDAWSTALEAGQEGDVGAVQAAWCELRALSDEYGVCLADFPVLLCAP